MIDDATNYKILTHARNKSWNFFLPLHDTKYKLVPKLLTCAKKFSTESLHFLKFENIIKLVKENNVNFDLLHTNSGTDETSIQAKKPCHAPKIAECSHALNGNCRTMFEQINFGVQ